MVGGRSRTYSGCLESFEYAQSTFVVKTPALLLALGKITNVSEHHYRLSLTQNKLIDLRFFSHWCFLHQKIWRNSDFEGITYLQMILMVTRNLEHCSWCHLALVGLVDIHNVSYSDLLLPRGAPLLILVFKAILAYRTVLISNEQQTRMWNHNVGDRFRNRQLPIDYGIVSASCAEISGSCTRRLTVK